MIAVATVVTLHDEGDRGELPRPVLGSGESSVVVAPEQLGVGELAAGVVEAFVTIGSVPSIGSHVGAHNDVFSARDDFEVSGNDLSDRCASGARTRDPTP